MYGGMIRFILLSLIENLNYLQEIVNFLYNCFLAKNPFEILKFSILKLI
jgi:hypothetical protein